jgi:hypothetical protein
VKILNAILCVCLISSLAFAQGITVRGKILTEENRTPLEGLTIREPGTPNYTSTDANGEFTLKLTSSLKIICVPECFTPLYVEYEENVAYKEIVIPLDLSSQIYKDSKRVEEKMLRSRPTRQLRGLILDKKTKAPIQDCIVKVSNMDTSVYSDEEGIFEIVVPNNIPVTLEIRKEKSFQAVTYSADEDGKKIMFKLK